MALGSNKVQDEVLAGWEQLPTRGRTAPSDTTATLDIGARPSIDGGEVGAA